MYRFFGALAIFCGWLSIPIGAVAGLVMSQFFDSGRVLGAAPPIDVYGVSVILVFWVYACVTILTALPLFMAAVAPDPRRPTKVMAAALGIVGVVLLPSELGRAFGLPIVAGAAGLWLGGDLVYRGGSPAAAFGAAESAAPASAPPAGENASGEVPGDGVAAVAAGDVAAGHVSAGDISAGDVATQEIAPIVTPGAVAAPDALVADSSMVQSETTASAPAPAPAPTEKRRGGRRPAVESAAVRTCPWCSTVVPAADPECANCGAALAEPAAEGIGIPGLTEVPAELRRYAENARAGKRRQSLLKMIFADSQIPTAVNAPPPSDIEALRPPSPELRAEMARFDAEIAAAAAPLDTAEYPTTAGAAETRAAEPGEAEPGEAEAPAPEQASPGADSGT